VLAELQQVIAGLQSVTAAETAAPAEAGTIPAEELKAEIAKLEALLEDSDSEAGDLLTDFMDKISGTPLARSLKPVADAINDYNFDLALEELKKVKLQAL
jgi:hypothetical protein